MTIEQKHPVVVLMLTEERAHKVLAALWATSRSGGGSSQWSIYLELSRQMGIQNFAVPHGDNFDALIMGCINTVIDEAAEEGVVQRIGL